VSQYRASADRVTANDTAQLRTFPDWRDEVPFRVTFIVVMDGGCAVALCCSVRITAAAQWRAASECIASASTFTSPDVAGERLAHCCATVGFAR
jgi:hypothetical protein